MLWYIKEAHEEKLMSRFYKNEECERWGDRQTEIK